MKPFVTFAALLAACASGLFTQSANAQCATCPQPVAPQPTFALSPVAPVAQPVLPQATVAQPTVAFSPVAVQQPVVLQTFRPVRPLFSGRILRRIFGFRDPVVVPTAAPPFAAGTPTFVTAAYQPTFPLTTAVLTPQVQTVARPVALAATTFRPVALSPVTSCPACCASGVTTASFNAPATCPNCAAGAATFSTPTPQGFTQPAQGLAQPTPAPAAGETPQPGIAPNANVPQQRLRPLPMDDSLLDPNDIGPASPANTSPLNSAPPAGSGSRQAPAGSGSRETFNFNSGTNSDAYYQAPQLFNPNARTTSRPAAPVWNAVYQQNGGTQAVSNRVYRVGPEAAAAPRRQQQGAGGWRSVRN